MPTNVGVARAVMIGEKGADVIVQKWKKMEKKKF